MPLKNKIPPWRIIIISAVIAVSAFTFAAYLLRQTGRLPKAAPGVPALSFAIEPALIRSGDEFDLIMQVNPNDATFYAFELYVGYDSATSEIRDLANPPVNIQSDYILIESNVDAANHFIKIVGTRTGSPFTGNEKIELARVTMRVKDGVEDSVGFGWDPETKLGDHINKELQDGIFFLSRSTGDNEVDLHLAIQDLGLENGGVAGVSRGQNLNVQVMLRPVGNPVKSYDFVLPYDSSKLTFQNSSDIDANIEIDPSSGFNNQLMINKIDPAASKIYLSQVVLMENGIPQPVRSASDVLLAIIRFRVKSDAPFGAFDLIPDDSSSFVFNTANENILTRVGGVTLDIGDGSVLTPTPDPSISPGFTGLHLQIKLPDLNVNVIDSDNVQVRAFSGGAMVGETVVRLIKYFDYYTSLGTVNFADLESGSYDISVKTSTSIGRTFGGVNLVRGEVLDCIGNAATSSCGELLAARDSKPLFSGDSDGFNTSSGSYNKIDSADLQKIAIYFNSTVSQDERVADYNMDGQVDILDLEILGKNYGIQGD